MSDAPDDTRHQAVLAKLTIIEELLRIIEDLLRTLLAEFHASSGRLDRLGH